MNLLESLLAGAGLAVAAGLSPFVPLLVVGVAGVGKKFTLNESLAFLGSWLTVIVAGLFIGVDIFASKLPALTRYYNLVNYGLRPLIGGLVFAAAVASKDLPVFVTFIIGAAIAGLTFFLTLKLHPALLTNRKYAVVFEPLISIGQDGVAIVLAILSMLLPILGGPLAILTVLIAGMLIFTLKLSKVGAEPASSVSTK